MNAHEQATRGADDGTRTCKGVATPWVLKTHVYTFSTTSASGKINSTFGLSFRPILRRASSSRSAVLLLTYGDSLKTVTRWYL